MFRDRIRLILMAKKGDARRLLYSHMRKIETRNFGSKFYTVSLYKKTARTGEGGAVALKSGGYRYQQDKSLVVTYILEAKEQRDHGLDPSLKKPKDETFVTLYDDVRLPEDPAVLKYYLLSGTILTVDEETGLVDSLKLIRLKINQKWALPFVIHKYTPQPLQVPIDRIGCNLKL